MHRELHILKCNIRCEYIILRKFAYSIVIMQIGFNEVRIYVVRLRQCSGHFSMSRLRASERHYETHLQLSIVKIMQLRKARYKFGYHNSNRSSLSSVHTYYVII